MSFQKHLLFLVIMASSNFTLAQQNVPILTSICVQNAHTNQQVIGVRVIVEELGFRNKVLSSDSLGGTVFITKNLTPNKKYRVKVLKDGYYTKDTTFITEVVSRSNKQRLGVRIYPKFCYNLNGQIFDASSSTNIKGGKIRIEDLTSSEVVEVRIQNGAYQFCGKCAHKYKVTSIVDGYLNRTETIELRSSNCYTRNEQLMKLDLVVASNYDKTFFEGSTIFIPNFTFVGNSVTLSIQGEKEISRLIQFLEQQPKALISIAIQASSFLERPLNRKLAEHRARLIEKKLTAGGIAAYRYFLKCKGNVDATYPRSSKKQQIKISLKN
jgi:outer membrane protein OmpA-like peptidoglycan-associated protein